MVDNLLSDKAVEKLQKIQKTEHSLFKFWRLTCLLSANLIVEIFIVMINLIIKYVG